MKTLTIFLLLLTFYSLQANEYNYTYQRLTSPLGNIAFSENIIILYSNIEGNGIIMVSTDKGETWTQKLVTNDSITINKIFWSGNSFYGLTRFSGLISADGYNWNEIKFPAAYNLKDMVEYNGNFYIAAEGKIIKTDKEFHIIEEYNVDYTSSTYLFHARLLFSGYNKGQLYYFDLNQKYLDSVDISGLGKSVSSMREYDGSLYAMIDNNLYKTTDLKKWELIADNISAYDLHDENIYAADVTRYGIDKRWLSKLAFYQIIDKSKVLINDTNNRESYANYNIGNMHFVDDNNIIAVSGNTNNIILKSSDKGTSWHIITYLNNATFSDPLEVKWFNEKVGIAHGGKQLFKTTDGGVNWMPSKIDSALQFKYILPLNAGYVNPETGTGLFVSPQQSPIIVDSSFNLLSFNIAFTDDYGETFKYASSHQINTNFDQGFNIHELDSSFILLGCWGAYSDFWGFEIKKGTLEVEYWFTEPNPLKFNNLASFYENGIFYAFAENLDKDEQTGLTIRQLVLLHSEDMARTWTIDTVIEKHVSCPFPKKNKNRLLALAEGAHKTLYYIDLATQDVKVINIDNIDSVGSAGFWGDQIYYTVGDQRYLIENDVYDNPQVSKLNIQNPSYGEFISDLQKINDSTIYARILREVGGFIGKFDFIKLIPEIETYVNEDIIEAGAYFYASQAYPNPAKDYVNAEIAWDRNCKPNDLNFEVYDLLFNRISRPGDIHFIPKGAYYGEIRWNCSGIKPGIYFIYIRCGGETRIVRTIVGTGT